MGDLNNTHRSGREARSLNPGLELLGRGLGAGADVARSGGTGGQVSRRGIADLFEAEAMRGDDADGGVAHRGREHRGGPSGRLPAVADGEERAAVARMAGLRDLPRLQASFDVTRAGAGGLRIAGRVSATVGQTCVVTLEPLTNEVVEEVELLFLPQAANEAIGKDLAPGERDVDEVEPLIGGSVDLGALATEFLVLGIDPYPRKAGAVFQPPSDSAPEAGPFASLASLKKGLDER